MKKFFISLFFITFLLTSCKAQKNQTADWYEFVSKDGDFKVLFPTKPNESVKETGEGTLKKQSYWLSVSQPQKTFMVTYADYPTTPNMNQDELRSNYDFHRDGMVKQANIKLISEREVWLDGRIGREMVIVDSKNIVVKYRIFVINKRFIQLITSVEAPLVEDEKTKKEVNKFLDSFQILDK